MQILARLKKQTISLEILPISEKTIQIKSRYHPDLILELKALEGARFDPEKKTWTASSSERNLYSLSTLERNDPRFALNFKTPENFEEKSKLMSHQKEMVFQGLKRRRGIIAGEMGTGKTFAAIRIMELISELTPEESYFWIVVPKSAKYSWISEMRKWSCSLTEFNPFTFDSEKPQKCYTFISYSSLEKRVTDTPISEQPNGIIFDEAHLLKNPEAQRTKAAIILASILRARSENALILLLTGTPAPKDPSDWWALTEICQAGYFRESTKTKFARRLGNFVSQVGQAGQEFQKLESWKPEELRLLNLRLRGMAHIFLKKDCLDLPDKIYVPIHLPFLLEMQTQISLLISIQGKGITALSKLRQRSDGFQYHSLCSVCSGSGKINLHFVEKEAEGMEIECGKCLGTGEETIEVETPKDIQLLADLEELEEAEKTRVVIYAAYHKTIDKIFKILQKQGWEVIRMDGRGVLTSEGILNKENWTEDWEKNEKKIAFLGHPKAGGLGLNLQKSEEIIFYSNDFDGASRPQAEDRIHRIGMTHAVIKDYLWLPTDYYVLGNLREKRNLQSVTIGELTEYVRTFVQEKFYSFGAGLKEEKNEIQNKN